jgi:DNA-binding NtrC family response regulator
LKEHIEDLPQLAEEFMRRFSRKHGVHVKGFTDDALRTLNHHNWPGNVRELQNVVERAVILCGDNGMLEPAHLGLVVSSNVSAAPVAVDGSSQPTTLADLEKQFIISAVERCKGNRTHAAKLLDISIRTLRNKLKEYNYGSSTSDEEEAAEV